MPSPSACYLLPPHYHGGSIAAPLGKIQHQLIALWESLSRPAGQEEPLGESHKCQTSPAKGRSARVE